MNHQNFFEIFYINIDNRLIESFLLSVYSKDKKAF
jgi:hypothetical protein